MATISFKFLLGSILDFLLFITFEKSDESSVNILQNEVNLYIY